jgi:hypothetical protein
MDDMDTMEERGYHGGAEGPRLTIVDRAERNRRVHKAWELRRSSDRLDAVSHFASVSSRQSQQEQQVAAMQAQIEGSFEELKQAHSTCGDPLVRFQQHTVMYCSLEFARGLIIPSCACRKCGVVSPPALAFGCFPSSPVEPSIWYDTSVLEFYKHLGTEEGVSATGGCCVFACVRACSRACVRACVRAC